jgi:hypothetical protein
LPRLSSRFVSILVVAVVNSLIACFGISFLLRSYVCTR